MVVLKNTVQNERYVSGIFDNEEKNPVEIMHNKKFTS